MGWIQAGLMECDDRKIEGKTAQLDEVHEALETLVNTVLKGARKKLAIRGSAGSSKLDSKPTADDLKVSDSDKQKLLTLVYNTLGADDMKSGAVVGGQLVAPRSNVETWLSKNLENSKQKYRFPFKDSCFRDTPVGAEGLPTAWQRPETAQWAISATVLVNGTLMGTDKWGHFFQEGYWYFDLAHKAQPKVEGQAALSTEKYLNLYGMYLEGHPDFDKEAGPRKTVLSATFGDFTASHYPGGLGAATTRVFANQPGFFGSWATGIVSIADMAANIEGYKFYQELNRRPVSFVFEAAAYATAKFHEGSTNIYTNKFLRDSRAPTKTYPNGEKPR